jgi:hypothetical protein
MADGCPTNAFRAVQSGHAVAKDRRCREQGCDRRDGKHEKGPKKEDGSLIPIRGHMERGPDCDTPKEGMPEPLQDLAANCAIQAATKSRIVWARAALVS